MGCWGVDRTAWAGTRGSQSMDTWTVCCRRKAAQVRGAQVVTGDAPGSTLKLAEGRLAGRGQVMGRARVSRSQTAHVAPCQRPLLATRGSALEGDQAADTRPAAAPLFGWG